MTRLRVVAALLYVASLMAGLLSLSGWAAAWPIALPAGPGVVARYDLLELTFALPTRYDNPFEPDSARGGVDVRALITTPPGGTETAVAFRGEAVTSADGGNGPAQAVAGSGAWKVRYAPRQPTASSASTGDARRASSSMTASPSCRAARMSVAVQGTALGVGRGVAVSARVASTNGVGIVVERPMCSAYTGGIGAVDGGHTGLGFTPALPGAGAAGRSR